MQERPTARSRRSIASAYSPRRAAGQSVTDVDQGAYEDGAGLLSPDLASRRPDSISPTTLRERRHAAPVPRRRRRRTCSHRPRCARAAPVRCPPPRPRSSQRGSRRRRCTRPRAPPRGLGVAGWQSTSASSQAGRRRGPWIEHGQRVDQPIDAAAPPVNADAAQVAVAAIDAAEGSAGSAGSAEARSMPPSLSAPRPTLPPRLSMPRRSPPSSTRRTAARRCHQDERSEADRRE